MWSAQGRRSGQPSTSFKSPVKLVPPNSASVSTLRVRTLSPSPHFASHSDHSVHGEITAFPNLGASHGAVSDNMSVHAVPPSVGTSTIERRRYFCILSAHVVHSDQSLRTQSTDLLGSQITAHSFVSTTLPEQGVPHSLLRSLILLWRSHTPVQSPPLHAVHASKAQLTGVHSPHAEVLGHWRHTTSRPVQELVVATGNASLRGRTNAVKMPHGTLDGIVVRYPSHSAKPSKGPTTIA
mmetsp:Transcript_260/g.621  ORF Transcript_260/g.621 Transcript_260/m.621 type:complete len:238 (+) Transcript_260:434-1147(+)